MNLITTIRHTKFIYVVGLYDLISCYIEFYNLLGIKGVEVERSCNMEDEVAAHDGFVEGSVDGEVCLEKLESIDAGEVEKVRHLGLVVCIN